MKSLKWLSIIFCLALGLSVLNGCASTEPKTDPKTPEEFTNIMKAAGFRVEDVTEESQTDGLGTAVITAAGNHFELEFTEFIDAFTGNFIFRGKKLVFDSDHPTKTTVKDMSGPDGNCYAFLAEGQFYVTAQIGKTMVYCEANEAYKDEILEYVEKLGYMPKD